MMIRRTGRSNRIGGDSKDLYEILMLTQTDSRYNLKAVRDGMRRDRDPSGLAEDNCNYGPGTDWTEVPGAFQERGSSIGKTPSPKPINRALSHFNSNYTPHPELEAHGILSRYFAYDQNLRLHVLSIQTSLWDKANSPDVGAIESMLEIEPQLGRNPQLIKLMSEQYQKDFVADVIYGRK